MDMDVVFLIEIRLDAEFFRTAADIGKASLCRFLHNVAELSRQDQFALARQHGHFSRQDVAADFCPGHACRNTDLRLLLGLGFEELDAAEEIRQILLRHLDRRFLPFDNLARSLATDLANEAFEFTYAGFARVTFDDGLQDAPAPKWISLPVRPFSRRWRVTR